LNIEGEIIGDLYVAAGVVKIDGTVNGNVKCYAGEVRITGKGLVKGNFTYTTEKEISEDEKQRVNGQVLYSESKKSFFEKLGIGKFFAFIFGPFLTLIATLAVLVTGLLLLLLPVLRKFDYVEQDKQFWTYLLWGLIPFFIYPAVIVACIVFVVTIPLALLLVLAGLPLLVFSQVLGVTLFGQFLFKKFNWNKKNPILYFLFGILFYFVFGLIPIIGSIGFIFFSCLGWGLMIEGIFKTKLYNGKE